MSIKPYLASSNSASVLYVLKRLAQTVVPNSRTGVPAYTSNSCHSQVAKGILKRGNPDDRIYLFGSDSGDVSHSILTDENDKVLVDAWKGKFTGKGYEADDTVLKIVKDLQVSDLFDAFQR